MRFKGIVVPPKVHSTPKCPKMPCLAPSESEQHSGWSGIRDNNADTAAVRDSQRPPETGHVECHDAVILTLTPTLVIIPISTWKYVYPIENI